MDAGADNVVQFRPRDLPIDGGKARILRKHDNFKFRSFAEPVIDNRDDLMMDHADPSDMPSDSAYFAPDFDAS